MAVERVKKYLEGWGRGKDVLEFDVSSATVELAAQALHVEPARIAKSLSFRGIKEFTSGAMPVILLVCAGDVKVDSGKFKQCFQLKAKMLNAEEVVAGTGYTIGGVCPFAIDNPELRVYLDESLKRFETVFPACGSGNSAIEMTCAELFECAQAAGWVDVCKN